MKNVKLIATIVLAAGALAGSSMTERKANTLGPAGKPGLSDATCPWIPPNCPKPS